jgi:hypothetical protein
MTEAQVAIIVPVSMTAYPLHMPTELYYSSIQRLVGYCLAIKVFILRQVAGYQRGSRGGGRIRELVWLK